VSVATAGRPQAEREQRRSGLTSQTLSTATDRAGDLLRRVAAGLAPAKLD
jgi:hypothetical protein